MLLIIDATGLTTRVCARDVNTTYNIDALAFALRNPESKWFANATGLNLIVL